MPRNGLGIDRVFASSEFSLSANFNSSAANIFSVTPSYRACLAPATYHQNVTPTITTERLTLRAWSDADAEPFAAMNRDPDVMRYFPRPLTREESFAMVERIRARWNDGWGLWAVERNDTQEFIGFVGFSQPRFDAHFTPCVEIGWRLAAPSWGQGFATEAALAALAWEREYIDFPRNEVVSFTAATNVPSRRVMEKIGMRRDPADDFAHPTVEDPALRAHVLYRLAL